MLAMNLMTRDVITVPLETGVEEAHELMKAYNIRRLPVVDSEGGLMGIVTDRDVRHVLIPWRSSKKGSQKEFYYLARDETVEEIMTTEVITIHPHTSVAEAARLIHQNKFGGLPVVDDEGLVVGIITAIDLIALLIEQMESNSS